MAQTPQPRRSTEADRHATLQSSHTPSRATSIVTLVAENAGEATPRPASPAFTLVETPSERSYRGFSSYEAYLAAFEEWAESKKYVQQDSTTLVGFYGDTTMQEYASKPRQEFGISKKWKERKAKKEARRASKG